VTQVVEAPCRDTRGACDDDRVEDRPWVVIVWNDPIKLMRVSAAEFKPHGNWWQHRGAPPHVAKPQHAAYFFRRE
jgi:hypothetical protein